jgi:hypothetical protein
MPKVIDYPSASFGKAYELADAVDYFGGNCTVQSCADRLNKKVSGGFGMVISSAIKHGLIGRKKDDLFTTQLYKDIKLAYNEKERGDNLRKAFLSPILYRKIYERFKGKELPISMLDKLLIREFGVDTEAGSRIAGYFVDGVKAFNLMVGNALINLDSENIIQKEENIESEHADEPEIQVVNTSFISDNLNHNTSYIIHIKGPGMDSKITINEEDDLLILDAMTRKIKKKLNEMGGE